MTRTIHGFLLFVALTGAVGLSGCSSSVESEQAMPTSNSSSDHDHADHDHSAANQEADAEAFAELSAEDRQMVELQKICPVTDAALGSMGTPIKVRVGDRDVFICCEGCREDLLENADKYLAKLSL